jgi:hypothetical protein
MGVEYKHYLIPRPNSFVPEPDQVVSLLNKMQKNHWIIDPRSGSFAHMEYNVMTYTPFARESGAFAQLGRDQWCSFPYPFTANWLGRHLDKDLLLCWPVQNLAASGLCYPLSDNAWDPCQTYYDIELHFSPDYVYHVSENIDPFAKAPVCEHCREGLEFDSPPDEFGSTCGIFYSSQLLVHCPECGTPFDVARLPAVVRDGRTGDEDVIMGGACYRFAIVVDCGKCIPEKNLKITPTLKTLCNTTFDCSFYEIGDYY